MSDELASSAARARRACSEALGALADATGVLIRNIAAVRDHAECDEDYDHVHTEQLLSIAGGLARLLADIRKIDEAPPAGDGTVDSMTPDQRADALRLLLAEEANVPAPLVVDCARRMGPAWAEAVIAALQSSMYSSKP